MPALNSSQLHWINCLALWQRSRLIKLPPWRALHILRLHDSLAALFSDNYHHFGDTDDSCPGIFAMLGITQQLQAKLDNKREILKSKKDRLQQQDKQLVKPAQPKWDNYWEAEHAAWCWGCFKEQKAQERARAWWLLQKLQADVLQPLNRLPRATPGQVYVRTHRVQPHRIHRRVNHPPKDWWHTRDISEILNHKIKIISKVH